MTEPQRGAYGVLLDKDRNPFRNFVAAFVCWGSRSKAYHAVLYIGNGEMVQAEPKGATIDPCHPARYVWSTMPLTPRERAAICAAGCSYEGKRYNWLDDLALGLARRFGWRLPGFVLRHVESDRTMQCAQLVDAAYRAAGVRLFDDGRVPGAVTPGDLYDLIESANEH